MNETSQSVVQRFIADEFKPFQPSSAYLHVPTFCWHSIFTTNYDRVLEEAYLDSPNKLQELAPILKNGDPIEETIRYGRAVPYYKLHGCITCTDDQELPLMYSRTIYFTQKE